MKKIISICIVLTLVITTGCATAKKNQNKTIEEKALVIVITDTKGIGDQSFNDAVIEAIENAQKDSFSLRCIEASVPGEYEEVLKVSIAQNPKLIIGVGSNMKDAFETAATENKEINFGIIDAHLELNNTQSIEFADNEASFIAGYIAGKTTKTGKVAFVGGDERENVELAEAGFRAGVSASKTGAIVVSEYVGSFYDEDRGFDITKSINESENADIVMHVAGHSGVGVIKAAKELDIWTIGMDKDQSKLASKNVLCSVVKNMDEPIDDMIIMAISNNFKRNNAFLNLDNEGVGISDNAGNLDKESKEIVEKLTEAIKIGQIKVPKDLNELKTFVFDDTVLDAI